MIVALFGLLSVPCAALLGLAMVTGFGVLVVFGGSSG